MASGSDLMSIVHRLTKPRPLRDPTSTDRNPPDAINSGEHSQQFDMIAAIPQPIETHDLGIFFGDEDRGLQQKPQNQWILFGIMGLAAAVAGLVVLIFILAVAAVL